MALDRAQQLKAHQEAEKRNPLSPANREAKRQAMLAKLRDERGVPEPKPRAEQARNTPSAAAEQTQDAAPTAEQLKAPIPQLTPEQATWMQQQQTLADAEKRAREAGTSAQKRQAEAEAAEARAAEKLKKMELAMSNPAEFMTETGMTQDEWNAFWANGGKLSPEQKRMREMEAKMASYAEKLAAIEKQSNQERADSARRLEDAQFTASLKDYTFLPEVGGIAAVRQRQAQLSQQKGEPVALKEAADTLEREVGENLGGILKKSHILAKLGLAAATDQPPAKPASQAKTLTARTVGDSTPKSSTVKGPLDWAGKRARYLERIAADREAARNR